MLSAGCRARCGSRADLAQGGRRGSRSPAHARGPTSLACPRHSINTLLGMPTLHPPRMEPTPANPTTHLHRQFGHAVGEAQFRHRAVVAIRELHPPNWTLPFHRPSSRATLWDGGGDAPAKQRVFKSSRTGQPTGIWQRNRHHNSRSISESTGEWLR